MSNEKQTLIILTPGFAASEEDSTCLPMHQYFVRTIKKIYPQLNIVVLSFQYPYRKNSYRCFNATVLPFNGRNRGGLPGFLLRRKVSATLKKIHNTNKIVGVLSFWYGECALVGKRFAEKNNLKHYCWILGQDARKINKYPGRVLPNANELIALSDFLQAEFEKNHAVKPFAVIPPGVETQDKDAFEKSIDLLGAGSLIQLKQFSVFLEVVAEIKKTLPAVKAVLIGEGPEKEQLQDRITKLGIEKNILLAGELAHPEVLRLMQRTKVLLHPSIYEGFSGVCQEALGCGVHVISFCKAMQQEIEQWHIVETKKEMLKKAIEILQNTNTVFKRITPYAMEDSVKKMMELFQVE
jgi:glycosyltransferase involved in cell wall biosynthesis